MREHDLYGPIITLAAAEGVRLFRIHDTDAAKNPFDIAGVGPGGKAVAIEVKVLKGHHPMELTIPWGKFEVHQRAWIRAYVEANGLSIATLYYPEYDLMKFILLNLMTFETGQIVDATRVWDAIGFIRDYRKIDGLRQFLTV